MIGVMDVSGTMEILMQKEKAEEFSRIIQESSFIMAPDLYISELSNSLWKYYTMKIYTKEICHEYIRDGIDFIDKFISSQEIWEEAFAEGIKNNHSIYDMLYMVTARRYDAVLITNDSVLKGISKKNHIQVCN